MKITVAHSPDSDDAFMHYGLASGKVPTDGIEFGHLLADIETLNRAAFEGKYEVSAVSFNAYAHLTDKYLLLPHGSSMGDDYGPIVVARNDGPSSSKGITVAVPGHADDGVSHAAPVRPGRRLRRDAVRSHPGCRAEGRSGGRPADSRRAAHLPGRRAEEDRRPRRVVGRAHRRAAAAARRQRHPPRPRAGHDQEGVAPAAREHRVRAGAPRGGARLRAAVRPRPRSRQGRPVRRHVRQRAHPRVRRARPRGRSAPAGRGVGEAPDSRSRSSSNTVPEEESG